MKTALLVPTTPGFTGYNGFAARVVKLSLVEPAQIAIAETEVGETSLSRVNASFG